MLELMNRESLSNADWLRIVDRLGGAELFEAEARELGAFHSLDRDEYPPDLQIFHAAEKTCLSPRAVKPRPSGRGYKAPVLLLSSPCCATCWPCPICRAPASGRGAAARGGRGRL